MNYSYSELLIKMKDEDFVMRLPMEHFEKILLFIQAGHDKFSSKCSEVWESL